MSESTNLPKVLFTTTLSDSQKSEVKSNYFTFESIPFISFEYFQYELWKSQLPENYDTWVFTSKRAVKALKPAINSLSIPEHIFAVGEKTAEKLQNLSLSPKVPDEYNLISLANLMDTFDLKNIIHFCGNLKTDNLADLLADKSVNLNSIEVYQTKYAPKKIDASKYAAVVFMSPSSVESFHQENTLSKQSAVFCIGPSTAKALDENGVLNYKVSEKSTLKSLAESLNNHFS